MFVLALIPLSLILRKGKAAYEFSGSKEKINDLLFMDSLKLCGRNEGGLDSLVQTICVLSEDIGMEFGIEKYTMLVIEKCKYKYLGILEADKFLEEEMKLKVSTEYFRRLRKVLKSKLNGGNLVQGVNTWAVSL